MLSEKASPNQLPVITSHFYSLVVIQFSYLGSLLRSASELIPVSEIKPRPKKPKKTKTRDSNKSLREKPKERLGEDFTF